MADEAQLRYRAAAGLRQENSRGGQVGGESRQGGWVEPTGMEMVPGTGGKCVAGSTGKAGSPTGIPALPLQGGTKTEKRDFGFPEAISLKINMDLRLAGRREIANSRQIINRSALLSGICVYDRKTPLTLAADRIFVL